MKKLFRTKASNFAKHPHCSSRSLIEQSKRSGLKNVAESATEDNPGRPGKGWRQLVSPSPPIGESQVRGIYHQFLWPESCPVSSHTNQELSCKARLETALSRVRHTGSFDPCANAVTPEGLGCYCADQNAVAVSGGTTPPKGPARRTSRARNGIVIAGRERT